MAYIEKSLDSAVERILSNQNYEQSFAFYRLWLDIQRAYPKAPPDPTLNRIWRKIATNSIVPVNGKLIHPTIHLVLRFVGDLESDHVLGPRTSGLQSRLCARGLQEFFSDGMTIAWHNEDGSGSNLAGDFYAEANLIAHCINSGYAEEAVIHDHILQSLISHPKLHDHQADALIILFKLAGATFEAYADPSVIDCCFELIKGHYSRNSVRGRLVQVRIRPSGKQPPG